MRLFFALIAAATLSGCMTNHVELTVHNNTDAPVAVGGRSIQDPVPAGESTYIPFIETKTFLLFSTGKKASGTVTINNTEYLLPKDFVRDWNNARSSATVWGWFHTHGGDIAIAKNKPPVLTEDKDEWVLQPKGIGLTTTSSVD